MVEIKKFQEYQITISFFQKAMFPHLITEMKATPLSSISGKIGFYIVQRLTTSSFITQ